MNSRWQRSIPGVAAGLCLAALLLVPGEALAWREAGHFAICEIAYRNLQPEARQRIDALLDGKDFATQCTWPDIVRRTDHWKHTYPWHYINLDDGKEYFAAGHIEPRGDVLQALLLSEAKLLDETSTKAERLNYLRFLGHFAGDVHQPLHVGRKDDRGGNDIEISWFGAGEFESISVRLSTDDDGGCTGRERGIDAATGECVERRPRKRTANLHQVWDLLMIQRFIDQRELRAEAGDSEHLHKAYATLLEGQLDRDQIASDLQGSFWDWTAESLRDRDRVYAVGDGQLGEDYYRRHIDYLNRRVALAGYRLAFTLNRIFAAASVPEAKALAAEHRRLRDRIVELTGESSPLAGL